MDIRDFMNLYKKCKKEFYINRETALKTMNILQAKKYYLPIEVE